MSVRRLLRAVVAAAVVAAPLLLAAPAHAADGITIDHVEVAGDGTVSVLLGVDRADAAASPDLGSVRVHVDGQAVRATAQPVAAGQVTRTTVLVLDTSQSMTGQRISEAKAAATAFLGAAPSDVRIGLLTFSGRVRDVIAPTTDRDALTSAIDDIALTGGTHVYNAVVRAVALAGTEGSRNVLLLSDGKDQGGSTPLTTAVARARDRGVVVDVVALQQDAADRGLLGQVARASGGDVVRASDPASLGSVFTAEADALSHQVLVTFPRPDTATDEVDLAVALSAGTATYDDTAHVSLGSSSSDGPIPVTPAKPLVGGTALIAGGAALGLGLMVLLALVLTARRGPSVTQRRLAAYLGEAPASVETGSIRDSAVAFTANIVSGDFETRLAQRLAGAGIAFTAAEWVLLHAGIAVAAGFGGLVLGGPVLMVVLLLAGCLLPAVYLRRRHAKRLAAFGAQLPETLTLIAGSLSAGLSVTQAIDTVVREGHEPMASELRRALVEHRLGIDVEEALEGVGQRMASEDFAWVVMAIRIQREVGGNLAEVLNTVADTLREREYLRRQVRSLSAEGRLSAYILGGLPVVLFLYMLVANRPFVRPLYTELLGWAFSGAAIALLASGSWFMSRLVKVEV